MSTKGALQAFLDGAPSSLSCEASGARATVPSVSKFVSHSLTCHCAHHFRVHVTTLSTRALQSSCTSLFEPLCP